MFEQQSGDGPLVGPDRMRSAQAKWDRLTAGDYAEIRSIADLVARLALRYGLPPAQAQRDVEIWARDPRA
jgi:hypothetical protein